MICEIHIIKRRKYLKFIEIKSLRTCATDIVLCTAQKIYDFTLQKMLTNHKKTSAAGIVNIIHIWWNSNHTPYRKRYRNRRSVIFPVFFYDFFKKCAKKWKMTDDFFGQRSEIPRWNLRFLITYTFRLSIVHNNNNKSLKNICFGPNVQEESGPNNLHNIFLILYY